MFAAYINGATNTWDNEKNFIGFLDLMFSVTRSDLRKLKAGDEVSMWCHTIDESVLVSPKPTNSIKYVVKLINPIAAEFHHGLPILTS